MISNSRGISLDYLEFICRRYGRSFCNFYEMIILRKKPEIQAPNQPIPQHRFYSRPPTLDAMLREISSNYCTDSTQTIISQLCDTAHRLFGGICAQGCDWIELHPLPWSVIFQALWAYRFSGTYGPTQEETNIILRTADIVLRDNLWLRLPNVFNTAHAFIYLLLLHNLPRLGPRVQYYLCCWQSPRRTQLIEEYEIVINQFAALHNVRPDCSIFAERP